MTPACAFCGTKADDAEALLQSATHLGTYICSWCVEATLPAIATFRRNRGWKRIPPPVPQLTYDI